MTSLCQLARHRDDQKRAQGTYKKCPEDQLEAKSVALIKSPHQDKLSHPVDRMSDLSGETPITLSGMSS
jgi:hypothetical protein